MGLTKTADFTQAHDFPDPAKAVGSNDDVKAEFVKVREMIKEYVENFILENKLK